MRDRADVLRRRIAYYRRRLSEGVDAGFAQEYVRQIVADEAELAEIEKGSGSPRVTRSA